MYISVTLYHTWHGDDNEVLMSLRSCGTFKPQVSSAVKQSRGQWVPTISPRVAIIICALLAHRDRVAEHKWPMLQNGEGERGVAFVKFVKLRMLQRDLNGCVVCKEIRKKMRKVD